MSLALLSTKRDSIEQIQRNQQNVSSTLLLQFSDWLSQMLIHPSILPSTRFLALSNRLVAAVLAVTYSTRYRRTP
jgi:hypothetical protein